MLLCLYNILILFNFYIPKTHLKRLTGGIILYIDALIPYLFRNFGNSPPRKFLIHVYALGDLYVYALLCQLPILSFMSILRFIYT